MSFPRFAASDARGVNIVARIAAASMPTAGPVNVLRTSISRYTKYSTVIGPPAHYRTWCRKPQKSTFAFVALPQRPSERLPRRFRGEPPQV